MKKSIKLSAIVLTIILSLSLSACFGNKSLSRTDFTIQLDSTLTGAVVEITPSVNIKSITYKLTLYDSDHKIVKEDFYTRTNLTKDKTYKYTHDVGFMTMLTASTFYVEFIKGEK